jgi:hypothetical protein
MIYLCLYILIIYKGRKNPNRHIVSLPICCDGPSISTQIILELQEQVTTKTATKYVKMGLERI